MNDKDETPQVHITGDGQVTGDDSPAQMIKAEGGSTISNVTQIGKVIVQFVDEKVFKRLGLEQRVGFALLAILVIGAGVGGPLFVYQALHPRTPERMVGDFRIAVAGFVEQGVSKDSRVGTELAQGVYLRLQQAFDELNLGFTVAIWGPDQVGTIEGQTATERAGSAAQVAERIGADLVIYGIVDITETIWQVAPEFYVYGENFYQAEEITGQYSLGTPLSITGGGNPADRIKVSSKLASRTRVISNIAVGLAYYSIRDFEKALGSFQSAEEVEGWEDNEGRHVLYILSGNAAIKSNDLDLAKTYYQKSLDLAPEYSRGYLGLANVYYMLALEPFEKTLDPADTDAGLLSLAVATYEQAVKADDQPPLSDIATKVHFGLGQVYLMHTYSGEKEAFDSAIVEFEAVIEEYADGANPRVREIAAESHARLALIYELSGYTAQAIEEYQLAASLLYDNPDRQAQYEQRVQDLQQHIDEIQ